jgi:integrase
MSGIPDFARPGHENTIQPLNPADRRRLISYIEGPSVLKGGPYVVDPKRLVLFLYETGMHPDVLAHPERKYLHIEPSGNIVWVRAKKEISDSNAFINLAPHRRIVDWYRDFIASLPRLTCEPASVPVWVKVRGNWVQKKDPETGELLVRAHCNCATVFDRIVYKFRRATGIPGFCARSCRHTFACRWYELTHDIRVVMDKTGCSMTVALRYAKLVDASRWDEAGADLEDSPAPRFVGREIVPPIPTVTSRRPRVDLSESI